MSPAAVPPSAPPRVFDESAVQSRLIELSRTFLHQALDGHTDACLPLFAEGALWLGPTTERADRTVEGFRRLCDELRKRGARVILSAMSCEAIPHRDPALCSIVIQSIIHWGFSGSGNVGARPLRVSFLWRRTDAPAVRIAALNVGFLLDDRADDAPDGADRIAEERGRDRIAVRDIDGNDRYLDPDEILYLQAKGRQTIVHELAATFTSPESIGDLQERLDDRFVRLHRTYLVNGRFVKSLAARGAVMADGAVLPVPARRLGALRDELGAIKRPTTLTLADLERAVRSAMADIDAAS